MDGLDPADRDALIRTVVTEAGTPEGWGAVANTVKNRLAAGKFGDSPAAIVTAPGQFEVWANGRAQSVDPSSPQYQAAGRVVDAVAAGAAPDNTNGATHFFSPSGQAALAGDGRQQVPSWAKNQTASVAGNVFFAPNGRVTYKQAPQDAPQQQADPVSASASPAKASDPSPFDLLMSQSGSTASPAGTPAKAAEPATPFDALMSQGTNTATPGQTASPANTPAPKAVGPNALPAQGGDSSAAVGAGILNGVPIVGPALLGGAERLAAGVRSLQNDTPFSTELANVQKFTGATAANNPVSNTAGQVGGAVVGMAPLVAAAPGALGMGAGSMLSRMGAGTASNALIGAADAGARGQDPGVGAVFGGAGGFAGPVAGRIIGAGASAAANGIGDAGNALSNYIRTGSGSGIPGIGRSSANLMNSVINADDPTAITAFLKQHGPDAALIDAGPSLTAIGGGLATKPSAEKSLITNFLADRAAGANDRIGSQVESVVGPDQSNVAIDQALKGIKTGYGAAYDTVHANAPPVDTSSVVDTIDSQLKTATGPQKAALNKIRSSLVDTPEWQDPATGEVHPETYIDNSRVLHNVRQDVDGMIKYGDPTIGVQPSTLSRTQGSVSAVRSAIDDALKSQVPGMADADARSALMSQNIDAAANGYDSVFGKNVPHPDDFAAARADANPATNALQNAGMASRIHREFGTGTQRSAVTLNRLLPGGGEGYSAQNLSTAFGDQPVSNLLDTLSREQAFNNTNNAVIQNSATAGRTAANKLLEQTQPGSLNLLPATATGMAMQAGKSMIVDPLVKIIMESPNAPRNLELARMLTAQGATRDQVFTALQQLNGSQQGTSAIGNAMQQAMAGGANRLLLATGATNRP